MVSKRKQPTGMLVNGTTSLIVSIHEPTLEELYIYILKVLIIYVLTLNFPYQASIMAIHSGYFSSWLH